MELCRCYNTAFIEIGMAGQIDDMGKIISEWVRCPVCGNKTRLQIRADTEKRANSYHSRIARFIKGNISYNINIMSAKIPVHNKSQ